MSQRHEFRPTWAAWFWLLVLTVGMAAPYVWWHRRGVRYEVTPDRVVKHTGRLSSKTDEFQLEDVKRVRTKQSVGEKLFGAGSIVIDSGVDEMKLSAVPNHDQVVQSIRNSIN